MFRIPEIFQLHIMKGHNACVWLRVAEVRICGRSCLQTYCKVHLAIIRKGREIPVPCRICGSGVQSDIELCRACGRDKIRQRHIRMEKIAKQWFKYVMKELLMVQLVI